MAFERYITKSNRLFIVIRRLHSVVQVGDALCSSPTTVEMLDVTNEKLIVQKHVEFEELISSGKLTRVVTT